MGEPAAFPTPLLGKPGLGPVPQGVKVGQRHRTQLGWEAGVPYRLTGLVATEPLGAAEASVVFVSCSPLLDLGED